STGSAAAPVPTSRSSSRSRRPPPDAKSTPPAECAGPTTWRSCIAAASPAPSSRRPCTTAASSPPTCAGDLVGEEARHTEICRGAGVDAACFERGVEGEELRGDSPLVGCRRKVLGKRDRCCPHFLSDRRAVFARDVAVWKGGEEA